MRLVWAINFYSSIHFTHFVGCVLANKKKMRTRGKRRHKSFWRKECANFSLIHSALNALNIHPSWQFKKKMKNILKNIKIEQTTYSALRLNHLVPEHDNSLEHCQHWGYSTSELFRAPDDTGDQKTATLPFERPQRIDLWGGWERIMRGLLRAVVLYR